MVKAGKWLWNFLTGRKERSREKDFESWSSLKLTPPPPPPAPPPSPPSTPKERRRRSYSLQRKRVSPNEQLGRPAAAVKSGFSALEKVAAIKIQASFRGFLARKALRALKGLVKLQAAVRGFLVRKQAAATIRSMQALLTVQVRARAMRVRMSREAHDIPPHQRRMMMKMMKMMEPRVHQFHDKERNSNSRKSNTSKPHRTTSSEPSSSYMANTESWKAKARSQSVPRQRNGSPEASQLMKTRPSFDGKSLTRAAWASSVSSVAAREKVPWPIMLDRSRTNGSLFRFITA